MDASEVFCGYEADPTGFGLYRKLEKTNIPCVLIASTSLPKAPGNRVKTNRKFSNLLKIDRYAFQS